MPPSSNSHPAPRFLRAGIGPLLLAVAFIALTLWSWRKWPDVLVDFGRELYLPWQLIQGKVLYRDIALNYGCFPQYLNAFFFKLFGVSFTTLIYCNLAILAGITSLIYLTLVRACDRLTAAAAGLILLLVFAFPQYAAIGGMNFVAPYSHAATHGVALAVAMLAALALNRASPGRRATAGAGLCFGFVFLTKPEIFLAALLAALAWAGALLIQNRPLAPGSFKPQVRFLVWALLPVLGFLIYFAAKMPLHSALQAVSGAWAFALNPELSRNFYYQFVMGLDQPRTNLFLMAKIFSGMALFFLLATALDLAATKLQANRGIVSSFLALALTAGFWLKPELIPWLEVPRALPITTLLAGMVFGWKWLRHRQDPAQANSYLALVMWSAFAFGLLTKMLFNVRFSHYGFYLAMPATLVLVAALVWFWPAFLKNQFQGGRLFRGLALLMLALGAWSYGQISHQYYGWKNYPLGKGGDLLLGYDPEIHPRDWRTAQALRWIEQNTPAEATLMALPEGTILNYLARRPNPTPYIYFTMIEMISFGEDNMLRAMQAAPPDLIVLTHVSSEDYGVGFFGQDPRYSKSMMDWIQPNYETAARFGDQPFQEASGFGIKILRHK